MTDEPRVFPMQGGPPIPWETAEVVYQAYSKLYGTSQSLQKLADRGGFGWAEVGVIFDELARYDQGLYQRLVPERSRRRYQPPRR